MDFVHQSLFGILKKNVFSEIKLTGYASDKILIVTKSDEVYGLGPLPDRALYTDNLEFRPIPVLHKKNVERFVWFFGERSIFFLTANGEVYSWGENGYGQLGLTGITNVSEPTLISSLKGKKVIDIACTMYRTVMLTSDQEIYMFGKTMTASHEAYHRKNATGITCTSNAAFYLSYGRVYGLGYLNDKSFSQSSSSHYSIGNGYSSDYNRNWVEIKNLKSIEKIVGGRGHVIALNSNGVAFVWGENQSKQLSNQLPPYQGTPIKLPIFSEKIIDIAANSSNDLSAVLTENSKLYVWGAYYGGVFSKPYVTLFTTFEEVFSCFATPRMTYRGITVQDKKRGGGLGSIFDKQNDSDLSISVQGKIIHVHKAILKAKCKYFETMFSNQWKESGEKVVKIDGFTYNSYRNFLSYLYTGEIEITLENVFELVAIADKYSDKDLMDLIERNLDRGSIPDESLKIVKDIMKLSQPTFEKLFDGIQKMMISSIPKISKS